MKNYPIIIMNPTGKTPDNLGTKIKSWENLSGKSALVKMNQYEEIGNTGTFDVDAEKNSYNVSEKIFSEIALFLGFNCVKIDFIVDSQGFNWLASYDYNRKGVPTFSGKALYTNTKPELMNRNSSRGIDKNYHYEDILKILYRYGGNSYKLIREFNKMMIMDALTGESDRHYENWGIAEENNTFSLLPMYDNSACLLHFARNEISLNYLKRKEFENFSKKSYSKIMINNKKTSHFDFLKILLTSFDDSELLFLKNDIEKLHKLTNEKIYEIVNKVPDCFCTLEHKKLITEYILIRRNHILTIMEEI